MLSTAAAAIYYCGNPLILFVCHSRCSRGVMRPRLSPREDPRRTLSPPPRKLRLKSGDCRQRRRKGWRGSEQRQWLTVESRLSLNFKISVQKLTMHLQQWRQQRESRCGWWCSQRLRQPDKQGQNNQRLMPTWNKIVPQDHCKKKACVVSKSFTSD